MSPTEQQSHGRPFQQWVFNTISNTLSFQVQWCAILSPHKQASNTKNLGMIGMSPAENKTILSRRKMEQKFKKEENDVTLKANHVNLLPNLVSHYWRLRAEQHPMPISKISPKCHHCQITVFFWIWQPCQWIRIILFSPWIFYRGSESHLFSTKVIVLV